MQASKIIVKVLFSRLTRPKVPSIDSDQSSHEDPSQTRASLVTSLALLREIGELSVQVPYIKGAAGVLLRVTIISDTLNVNKAQLNEMNYNLSELAKLLDEATTYAKGHSWTVPPDLQHTLEMWPQELKSIENALVQFNNQKKKRLPLRLLDGGSKERISYCNKRLNYLTKSYKASLLFTVKANADFDSQPLLTNHRANTKIPAYSATFYGRDSHMMVILDLLNDANKWPVRTVILGVGGIGKTTLALAILHHPTVVHKFNERIHFISCEGCLSTSMLVNEIAKVLGIQNDSDSLVKEQEILSYLESAPSLLCLDNFETLWNADSQIKHTGTMFLQKLGSVSCVSLIVTMRGSEYPEGIDWSKPLLSPLQPLSFETSQKVFENISNKWDEWADRLVQAVEGLPLALTIIAHLAQSQDCRFLWQQWEETNIRSIKREKGHRLTSLETSIELSIKGHHLKSHPTALVILSLLGMLPGGLAPERLDCFQYLFSDTQSTKESMNALLKSGLVYQSFDTLHVHPLIRYYSQEHLPLSAEHMKMLTQHYIDLTLKGGRRTTISAVQLLEYKNTGYILLHCLSTRAPDESLVKAIGNYSWLTTVETGSFVPELFELLEQKKDFLSPHDVMDYQMEWGHCLKNSGSLAQAHSIYIKGLKYAEKQEDEIYEANFWECLGDFHWGRCEYDLSRSYYTLALNVYKKNNILLNEALILSQLSVILRMQFLLNDAKECAIQSIELYDQIDKNNHSVGFSWLALGHVYRLEENLGEARLCFHKGLEIFTQSNWRNGQSDAYQSLGDSYMMENRYEVAKDYYFKSLFLKRQINRMDTEHYILDLLGRVHLNMDEYQTALDFFQQALKIHQCHNDPIRQGTSLRGIGNVYLNQGMYTDAINYLNQAIALHESCSNIRRLGEDFDILGKVYYDMDQPDSAMDCWEKALTMHTKVNNLEKLAYTYMAIGWICFDERKIDVARTYYFQAWALCEKHGYSNIHATVLRCLGRTYIYTKGGLRSAIEWYQKALKVQEKIHDPKSNELVIKILSMLKGEREIK
ncbi:TPR-like protein [Auriscalpium vulgare]|uniref:TPR-like protein n=1 Tax=Auriscalpium vulgare TaxID=40419 RepID=A0ACB8R497_9AGAM|nr:TPR-like protein [Auriscalpium vulgare]